MPLKSKHTTRAYPSIQPAWLLISEKKTRRLSSHAIWRDGPAGKSPPRALFRSVHSLPVTCRTQYVINTLSCCSSVTILMAAHPGSLGHLLCLDNIRKEVGFFCVSLNVWKSVRQHKYCVLYYSYATKLFLFDCKKYATEKCWLYRIPAEHKYPILAVSPNTDH